MSLYTSLILQFIPILFGVLAFIAIKRFNLVGRKIRIRTDTPEVRHDDERKPEGGRPEGAVRFQHLVYDMLIINGMLKKAPLNYERVGFSRFGLVHTNGLGRLPSYLRRNAKRRLLLVVSDHYDLLRRALNFNEDSGMLLSYLACYKVDIVSQW